MHKYEFFFPFSHQETGALAELDARHRPTVAVVGSQLAPRLDREHLDGRNNKRERACTAGVGCFGSGTMSLI